MSTAPCRAGCRVLVCRDCCCGTAAKHPDVDHDALLARLVRKTTGHAEVRVSPCLLACDRSNVVVVHGGRRGPVWFRHVLDESAVDAIARWVRLGGPGVAPLPADLRPLWTRPVRVGGR